MLIEAEANLRPNISYTPTPYPSGEWPPINYKSQDGTIHTYPADGLMPNTSKEIYQQKQNEQYYVVNIED